MTRPLSEAAFTALVDAGCPACKSKKLTIEALLVEKLPLLDGEVYGSPSWAYKGEDLVQGTHRIECHACKTEIFSATACPRCGAADGVQRALEGESAFPLPRSCDHCGSQQLTAKAFTPARVVYEGKRADKARSQAAPEEPGFHAFHIECKGCHRAAEVRNPCPLCSAQAKSSS